MFEVVLTKRAERSFNEFSEDVQNKCGEFFDELQYSFAPIRLDVKKIKGQGSTSFM
jgi:mRNA-degrading endonuclease RelE of RelBE toxin-antitoxin system